VHGLIFYPAACKTGKEVRTMATTFLTAVLSFASTNMDDILVLMILYAQVQNPKGLIRVVAGSIRNFF
jgi:cadmium resistance protein CadD (predicted permease)